MRTAILGNDLKLTNTGKYANTQSGHLVSRKSPSTHPLQPCSEGLFPGLTSSQGRDPGNKVATLSNFQRPSMGWEFSETSQSSVCQNPVQVVFGSIPGYRVMMQKTAHTDPHGEERKRNKTAVKLKKYNIFARYFGLKIKLRGLKENEYSQGL